MVLIYEFTLQITINIILANDVRGKVVLPKYVYVTAKHVKESISVLVLL